MKNTQKKFVLLLITILLLNIIPSSSMSTANAACSTDEEFYSQVVANLIARKSNFSITYIGNTKKLLSKDIFTIIKNFDNPYTSNDFDYLIYNIASWKYSASYTSQKGTIKFKISYRSTSPQETTVNKKVSSVIKELNLTKCSDYEKVKKIHDYIIKNTSYDQSGTKATAYNALINKSAVCQGYALLTYKLLTEAGVPNRIITGTASNGSTVQSHAWNIVKLDNYWYNLDVTWDDPIYPSNVKVKDICTDYFLISDNDLKTHTRNKDFSTSDFYKNYPMADKSFDTSLNDTTFTNNTKYQALGNLKNQKEVLSVPISTTKLKVGKSKTVFVAFLPLNASGKLTYTSSNSKIVSVNKNTGGIKALKKGTAVITAKTSKGAKISYKVTAY